jgi:hypothetical protein
MAPRRPGPLNRLFCENPLSGPFLLNRGPNFKIQGRGRSWARAGARWARAGARWARAGAGRALPPGYSRSSPTLAAALLIIATAPSVCAASPLVVELFQVIADPCRCSTRRRRCSFRPRRFSFRPATLQVQVATPATSFSESSMLIFSSLQKHRKIHDKMNSTELWTTKLCKLCSGNLKRVSSINRRLLRNKDIKRSRARPLLNEQDHIKTLYNACGHQIDRSKDHRFHGS